MPEDASSQDLAEVLEQRLRGVIDPELGLDIVELGMVTSCRVSSEGVARVEVALTTAACPLRGQLEHDVEAAALGVEGISSVEVAMGQLSPEAKARLMDRARAAAQESAPATTIPSAARVIGVSSGKGGVGKSSVTANLAVALARRGLVVGVLDADIWGFSIPRLLGVTSEVGVKDAKMLPTRVPVGDGELRVLSMGFLAEEEQAIMWRGLILSRAVQQFVEDADWSEVDYLLVDLPPGTGDIQMSLARLLPRTELLLVTTPALAAQKVAARAGDMARRGNLRLLGAVENMASFSCSCGEEHALFGEGGGQRLAGSLGVELLASIPIDPALSAGGDAGAPVALGEGPVAERFAELAELLVSRIAPPRREEGCSARMLDALEAAVGPPAEPTPAGGPPR